ncbi:MAG: exosome complex exonuclease Rrp41 [Nanoarchaeota archaeon]|nr:exosome complex exonuclease Rrp41 [Nanoarchaeota archaeon]
MTTYKRTDGRKLDELRPITAKVGVVPRAQGSAHFKIGDTEAIAAVYGPRELYPKFLQNPEEGFLRCHYNMMPFSGSGERVRPGTNRRSKEISLVIERSLRPIVDLRAFPNAVVDVFIELPQTDAGTRCAAICAASMALADAGILMKDLVSAVSVGKVEGSVIVDLDYTEDSHEEGVDIPFAVIHHSNEITLLQMDGIISKDDLLKGAELVKNACGKIYEIQKAALKQKFTEVRPEE